MRMAHIGKYALLVLFIVLFSCRGSKYGQKTEDEYTVLRIDRGEPVDLASFRAQEEAHNSKDAYAMRGLFDDIGTTATGMIVTGIRSLVQKEKEKYHEEYEFVIEPKGHHLQNDSFYFYKGISDLPFDPTDIQFTGFTILRMSGKDTALRAVFELDKSNLTEIFYDGIFRLRLTELDFNYARAKVYERGDQRVNLDFDIQFFSSYITKDGQLNNNVRIGSFMLSLPGVYLHQPDSNQVFAGARLKGYSFLVPRSYGYSAQAHKAVYSQGAYAIHVKVKETAKAKIVNRYVTEHTDLIFQQADKNIK